MASISTCFCPYSQSLSLQLRLFNGVHVSVLSVSLSPTSALQWRPCPHASVPTVRKKHYQRARNPSPKPNPPHLKLTTSTKELPSVGVEATTYTCLPPKEDFSLPSFDSSSYHFASEIKLSKSSSAAEIRREIDGSIGEEEEGDGNFVEANWEPNYGKFEIFEVDGEEEDEDEEEDDENWEDLGFKNGETIEFSGNEGDSEETSVKKKGVPVVMRCLR